MAAVLGLMPMARRKSCWGGDAPIIGAWLSGPEGELPSMGVCMPIPRPRECKPMPACPCSGPCEAPPARSWPLPAAPMCPDSWRLGMGGREVDRPWGVGGLGARGGLPIGPCAPAPAELRARPTPFMCDPRGPEASPRPPAAPCCDSAPDVDESAGCAAPLPPLPAPPLPAPSSGPLSSSIIPVVPMLA